MAEPPFLTAIQDSPDHARRRATSKLNDAARRELVKQSIVGRIFNLKGYLHAVALDIHEFTSLVQWPSMIPLVNPVLVITKLLAEIELPWEDSFNDTERKDARSNAGLIDKSVHHCKTVLRSRLDHAGSKLDWIAETLRGDDNDSLEAILELGRQMDALTIYLEMLVLDADAPEDTRDPEEIRVEMAMVVSILQGQESFVEYKEGRRVSTTSHLLPELEIDDEELEETADGNAHSSTSTPPVSRRNAMSKPKSKKGKGAVVVDEIGSPKLQKSSSKFLLSLKAANHEMKLTARKLLKLFKANEKGIDEDAVERRPSNVASPPSTLSTPPRSSERAKAMDILKQRLDKVEPSGRADLETLDDSTDEGDLHVDVNPEGRISGVVSGTLNQCIMYLTSASLHDRRFMDIFLLTYASFTTPEVVLDKLIQRFNIPVPTPESSPMQNPSALATKATDEESEGEDILASTPTPSSALDEEQAAPLETKRRSRPLKECNVLRDPTPDDAKVIRFRTINFLCKYLEKLEFSHLTDQMVASIFDMVEQLRDDGSAQTAEKVENALLTKLLVPAHAPVLELPLVSESNSPSVHDVKEFLSLEVHDFADQLMLYDWNIFQLIRPQELLDKAWSNPKLRYRSANILSMIYHFNHISLWTSYLIVRCAKLKERVRVFSKLVDLAHGLRKRNDFNSSVAIISGLERSPVFRLKSTKQHLPPRARARLERFSTLLETESNHKNYRIALREAMLPCVPHLGIFLTDLTHIEDGNPDVLPDGSINFRRWTLVHQKINEILRYQDRPVTLERSDSMARYIEEIDGLEVSDKELFALSLEAEPREKL